MERQIVPPLIFVPPTNCDERYLLSTTTFSLKVCNTQGAGLRQQFVQDDQIDHRTVNVPETLLPLYGRDRIKSPTHVNGKANEVLNQSSAGDISQSMISDVVQQIPQNTALRFPCTMYILWQKILRQKSHANSRESTCIV